MKPWLLFAGIAALYALSNSEQSNDKIGESSEDDDSCPVELCDWSEVPGHPYVTYAITFDCCQVSRVHTRCSHCGDIWERRCFNQGRINGWIYKYALLHGHGFLPTLKQGYKATGEAIGERTIH